MAGRGLGVGGGREGGCVVEKGFGMGSGLGGGVMKMAEG